MFDTISQDLNEKITNLSEQSSSLTERKRLPETLEKLQLFFVLATIFITPFFFLPLGIDWFDLPKTVFFAIMVVLLAVIGLTRLVIDSKFKITGSVIDKNLLLIVVAVIISAALSINRIGSLLAEPTQFFLLAAFFLIAVNTLNKLEKWHMAFNLLVWSAAILGGLFTLQSGLAILSNNVPALQSLLTKIPWIVGLFPANNAYTLAGVLALISPLALANYFSSADLKKNIGSLFAAGLIILGLLSAGWTLFNQRPILLDADTGRRVAMGVVGSSYQNALFGVGPGQYAAAFSQFKSADFNATPFWNLNFTTANSFAFYVLTIGGLALLFAFASLVLPVYRIVRKRLQPNIAGTVEKSVYLSLGLALVGIIFLPLPFLSLFVIFSLLALLFSWYDLKEVSNQTFVRSWNKGLSLMAVALITLVGVAILYGQGRLLLADLAMRQSLEAAAKNHAVDTYNAQVQAVQLAPWSDNYRVQLSRTNLALADSLASQTNLTDQQKQTVVQLVQQSLAEGRNAVSLEPNFPGNWANLALIYRNLINFAQGADQWSVTTETQAITLDPVNPQYRLDLGGIYFAAQNYQVAAQHFATAVQLKPDLANSHYNLAQALKQLKINDQASQQLQLVAQLVCTPANPNKTDCDKVKGEIADLNKNLGSKVAGAATESAAVQNPVGTGQQIYNNSTQSAAPNLPKAQTQPQVKITSPSGELAQ